MKYIVICSGSDYDVGTPWVNIVDSAIFDTYEDAFNALVKDFSKETETDSKEDFYQQIDNGEISDGEWPENSNFGKFGKAFYDFGDGPVIYTINTITNGI